MFYDRQMASTEKDRIIVAQIAGAAYRHARGRPLTRMEQEAAIAELNAAADGRADLLAEHAGLAVGCHEGDLDEARHLQAAQLCINAGADTSLISRWIEEGRRRAAVANRHRRLNRTARASVWRPLDSANQFHGALITKKQTLPCDVNMVPPA
jgi:hypothetical protein